jgi:hypothetical protein
MISNHSIHITTNTIILIIIAIIAFFILMNVMSIIIKIIACIAICWFLLMSVQSTNIANIPVVKQAYVAIEKVIPSKELWTKASSYINDSRKRIEKQIK